MAREAYSYDAVAWFYDELAALYSLGRIERSKAHHLDYLAPGERVLYVGAGRGRDALAAARRGARVTALDVSSRMLERIAAVRDRENLEVELVQGALGEYEAAEPFDFVVAHYFLNLFDEETTPRVLAQLLERLRPGGRLSVADFAPAIGGRGARWLTAAYYEPLNWLAWLAGFCARHPIPDHPRLLAHAGLEVLDVTRFPIGPGTDPAYWSVLAIHPG